MTLVQSWAAIVSSSLAWEEAHVSLERALDGLPAARRGTRPAGFPHSVWELVEHIRFTQFDLLDFCVNPSYSAPRWPDDYWPPSPEPPSDAAWDTSVAAIRDDAQALASFARDNAATLTETIPHGTGQTYLRTVLVAVDHAAYHVGQIVAVRRLLGEWKKDD